MRMPSSLRRHTAGLLLGLLLAGCGGVPPVQPAGPDGSSTHNADVLPLPEPPLLALPASALGCTLAVQQRLTVLPPHQAAQTLDALLEVDARSVKLALFHMGQRMGVLTWDGQQLHAELSRWWPQQLRPAQVLSDMQLALWPAAVVRSALPTDWQLIEIDTSRRLIHKLKSHISVQESAAHALEISYAQGGWRLQIDSPGGMHPCGANKQGS